MTVSANLPAAFAGVPVPRARAGMVLLHGRGATAESILTLSNVIAEPDVAYVAPQAPEGTWYPRSFLAPLEQNEPELSRSLAMVGALIEELNRQGMPQERVVLLGFSQGGCLALEYAARNARRYGAVVGLSAGLIGPDGTQRDYAGSLHSAPVFLGCSDVDAHIPLGRVRESTRVLRSLGGTVTERIYRGMAHTINDDELRQTKLLVSELCRRNPSE